MKQEDLREREETEGKETNVIHRLRKQKGGDQKAQCGSHCEPSLCGGAVVRTLWTRVHLTGWILHLR